MPQPMPFWHMRLVGKTPANECITLGASRANRFSLNYSPYIDWLSSSVYLRYSVVLHLLCCYLPVLGCVAHLDTRQGWSRLVAVPDQNSDEDPSTVSVI